jgi:hypothetical protein
MQTQWLWFETRPSSPAKLNTKRDQSGCQKKKSSKVTFFFLSLFFVGDGNLHP